MSATDTRFRMEFPAIAGAAAVEADGEHWVHLWGSRANSRCKHSLRPIIGLEVGLAFLDLQYLEQ